MTKHIEDINKIKNIILIGNIVEKMVVEFNATHKETITFKDIIDRLNCKLSDKKIGELEQQIKELTPIEDTTIQIETLMEKQCTGCGRYNTLGAYLNDDTNSYWIECFGCDYEYNSNIE